jgi:hypothetical protein
MRSWLSYFFTGTVAMIVSWALGAAMSGCRFGNHIEDGNTKTKDPYEGFYETRPVSVRYCGQSAAGTVCQNVNVVPDFTAHFMTNPVALLRDSTGKYFFLSPQATDDYALPTEPKPDRTIAFSATSKPETAIDDAACVYQIGLDETGQLTTEGPYTSGTKLPLSGRAVLTIDVVDHYDGACGPTMTRFHDCYVDVNACWGTSFAENEKLHAETLSRFDPYIDAGVLNVSDIPTATTLGYSVRYE